VLKKYNTILITFCLFLGFGFIIALFSSFKDEPKRKVKIIVIDPGHGGKDPGCNGVSHKEKDIALAVALKFGKLIEENMKDVKVIFTRKTDIFVDLEDRAKIANENNADLFISIHCNAAGKPVMIKDSKTGKMRPKTFKNSKGKLIVVETVNPVPYGSETYVMGLKNEEGKMKVAQRENSVILLEDNYEAKYQGFDPNSEESYIIMSNYTASYVIQSAGLALKIQEEYSKKAGRVDKGVHRQSIWVLWRTAMPSVLTELGYLTNPQEEIFLSSEKGQNYMASSLFRAFRRYKDEQEGVKKTYNDDIENQKPLDKEIYVTPNDSSNNEKTDFESLKKQPEPTKKDSSKVEKNKQEPVVVNPKDSENETKQEKEVDKNDIIKTFKEKTKKDSIVKQKDTPVIIKKDEIIFKVQFASADKEIQDTKTKFPNVSDVSFYKYGEVFKYTSGNFSNIDEAAKLQAKLRELGYKDCFVVAFKNNTRMDINEARKQANSNK
jgi:N-acetylmuramoyl-L-alanine amidase